MKRNKSKKCASCTYIKTKLNYTFKHIKKKKKVQQKGLLFFISCIHSTPTLSSFQKEQSNHFLLFTLHVYTLLQVPKILHLYINFYFLYSLLKKYFVYFSYIKSKYVISYFYYLLLFTCKNTICTSIYTYFFAICSFVILLLHIITITTLNH